MVVTLPNGAARLPLRYLQANGVVVLHDFLGVTRTESTKVKISTFLTHDVCVGYSNVVLFILFL